MESQTLEIECSATRCRRDDWPIGIGKTAVIYGGAAMLLWVVTLAAIPWLMAGTTVEPVLLWFVCAGLGVFLPILLVGIALLRHEGALADTGFWRTRLLFRRMNRADWLWSLAGMLVISVLAVKSILLLKLLFGTADLQPSFLRMTPLTPGRYWILAAWLPFFFVNIMGEELVWHGIILPRQEAAFGRWAWFASGIGWLLFHAAFGPALLFTLWPTTLIIPYLVQRQRNSWIGVLIHAGLNGGGFLALAFGLI